MKRRKTEFNFVIFWNPIISKVILENLEIIKAFLRRIHKFQVLEITMLTKSLKKYCLWNLTKLKKWNCSSESKIALIWIQFKLKKKLKNNNIRKHKVLLIPIYYTQKEENLQKYKLTISLIWVQMKKTIKFNI